MKKNYDFKKGRPLNILFVCFLILLSYTSMAQNLNFTIDTAVDNGTTITETIINGADTYVLTVAHSGNEELDNLGGGDLIFYLSATDPLTPHVLSITRNGTPANFTLNGFDYDTLGAGTISVTNQSNAEISSPTSYPLGAGAISITNMANATDISSFNIIPTDTDDLNDFGFHNINVDMAVACVPPAGTVAFTSQDCGLGEFFAEVNVTALGGGTPSIFDGTTTTPVVSTGVMNFGPYPIGTPVNFTLQHGSDTACDIDLGSISDTCPPPCLSPVGTATLSSQDCVAETFMIDVNVTDLGSGGSPVIFDGTTSTPVATTGITSLGPYAVGMAIPITLQHGSDISCDADLGMVSSTCDEIIFTIDTAVDDDVLSVITETIVKDGDTYVLTVAHSGNETLDELVIGSGDFVFFHSFGDALTPHVLSITRNGFPTNFTLKGIDYATGEAGAIAVTNQSDAEISSSTTYPIGDGAIAITNVANATDISSFNILPADNDDLNDFGFHNIKVDIIDTCAAGVATAIITGEDCVAGEFYVDVDVTQLGNGSTAIFDGTTSTPVTETGVSNFGPYQAGTSVSFTLQHGSDTTCDVDLGTITDACPPPANDECTGAIPVTCGETVTGATTYPATDSGENASNDVFYSFTDTVGQLVTLSLCNSDFDTYIRVFDDCPQTNQIAFNDDVCGAQSEVTFLASANTMYYFMVEGFGANNGNFEMTVTCVPLPANDECDGAIAVACGDTVAGSTVSATDSGENASNDVFYSFTDTILQDVSLSLCDSDYDTYIRVFDDCPQTNEIAGNDDSVNCTGNQSEITFTAQPNVTYYIMIEGYGDEVGNYDMSVTCIPNVPAPGNDLCANPTALTLATTATDQTTAGATDSTIDEDDDTTCQPYLFKSDVWYTFEAPLSGEVTIETVTSGASTAASIALYPNCGQLDAESLGCVVGDATGATLEATGLSSGVTYYVRVWSDGVAEGGSRRIEGTFDITATDTTTLSTTDLESDLAFTYYPNPVNTMLTLNSKKEISNVTVFNMLGQEVYNKIANSLEVNVDMSNLQTGAYFVRVTMDNVTKTIRVIKN